MESEDNYIEQEQADMVIGKLSYFFFKGPDQG